MSKEPDDDPALTAAGDAVFAAALAYVRQEDPKGLPPNPTRPYATAICMTFYAALKAATRTMRADGFDDETQDGVTDWAVTAVLGSVLFDGYETATEVLETLSSVTAQLMESQRYMSERAREPVG